ncbi:MAG: hypothetical protein HN849_35065, partial [Victivallales bacterium]|nr:hypothetical protein [Victivallales bacterium]
MLIDTRPIAMLICLVLTVHSVAGAAPVDQHVELRGDVVLYLPFENSLRASLPTASVGLDPLPTAKMETAG